MQIQWRRSLIFLFVLCCLLSLGVAQGRKIVRGSITKVLTSDDGGIHLLLHTEHGEREICLGSSRAILGRELVPSPGDRVEVEGVDRGELLIAQKLTEAGQTIDLGGQSHGRQAHCFHHGWGHDGYHHDEAAWGHGHCGHHGEEHD